MHPAEDLWSRHHPRDGYPEGVLGVPEPISGLAFFPGGFGLWGAESGRPLPQFPIGGVMVLGHDFHSEAGYAESLKLGGERLTLPTWSNLVKLLAAAGIAPQRCFFTNVYVGLRAGRATTGIFPGAASPQFVLHCQTFLLEQLRAQRPSLILTLGIHVPPVIGELSPDLALWTKGKGLKHLDSVGPLRTRVRFWDIDDYQTTIVSLIHPSLRHASLRHRKYKDVEGAEAELAMLRDAIAVSGLDSR